MPASLHDALDQKEWRLEEIRQVLRDDSSSINEEREPDTPLYCRDGRLTPLHRVLMDKRCSVDIVQLLLYYGADPNRRVQLSRWGGTYSPISMVFNSYLPHGVLGGTDVIGVLRALVEAGAKHDQTDSWNLLYAVKINADPEVIRLLVKAGADLLKADPMGTPLLFNALKFFDVKAFGSMLDLLDVDINSIRGRTEETLLHSAVRIPGCTTEFVEFLIDRGIDVNSVDWCGNSPLHVANTLDIIDTLLKRGAIVSAPDESGKTSLDQAIHLDYDNDVIKLLMKYFLFENPNFDLDYWISFFNLVTSLQLQIHPILKHQSSEIHSDYRAQKNLQGRMLESYGYDCKSELRRMSSEIVGNGRTLFDFLQTYSGSQMQRNGDNGFNFDHLLKLTIEKKHPLYSDLIVSKFGRPLLNEKLEDCHVRTVVRNRSGLKREISLNIYCACVVANFLKETDLFNMIVAFHK